jgi:Ras GTPase-activating-like protein IQGAP2/3
MAPDLRGTDRAATTYQSIRQSLRPSSRNANDAPIPAEQRNPSQPRPASNHSRAQSVDHVQSRASYDGPTSPPPKLRPQSIAISRSDSVQRHDRSARSSGHHVHFNPHLEKPELQEFQKSSTGHLRALSKLENEDLTLISRDSEVVGMQGRRKLMRGNSVRANKSTTAWGGSIWMDQQRQFLQAYEYLCHIGEAKEWIEDVMKTTIAPIVQLEEALRDGVTLAEIVQALQPERRYRIFRHQKLQFRHSDNIAIFFRFLEEIELPDLFWFELVDLYEKKNIPKVIYCIHALSWLLFRQGIVDFTIGNLVGQLQFEDHELEATQKGLDKAGVSMPNFSGMGATFGAEPEPEPVESEEERVNRELLENEDMVVELQCQIRGAMRRLRLGDNMQELWDSEGWIAQLQSKLRGDFSREVFQYRLDMRRFAVNLQSAARGFLIRCQAQDEVHYWKDREQHIVVLQSLVRARKQRAKTNHIKSNIQKHEHGVRELQAAIRGAFLRRDVGEEFAATREAEAGVECLQAAIRGAIMRKRVEDQLEEIHSAESQVEKLQGAVRAMLQRRVQQVDRTCLRQQESIISRLQAAARASKARQEHAGIKHGLKSEDMHWESLQSAARGQAVRRSYQEVRQGLEAQVGLIRALQAVIRGSLARCRLDSTKTALARQQPYVHPLQARSRAFLLRNRLLSDNRSFLFLSRSIVQVQSALRGFIARQRTEDLLNALYEHEDGMVALQSMLRASICSRQIGTLFMKLEAEEEMVEQLQAYARGQLVRVRFAEKMKFYKENMRKVVKIQSFIRGRQQGEAYKTLTSGKNPPVGTIKNFVHLLNDSDFDFDEEIGKSFVKYCSMYMLTVTEFERLRKTVVHQVRQNELAEQYIDQLDVKIALLVKNKITLDEVVKHQRHFGGHVGNLLTNKELSSKDPFDLKALNKNSRNKLEHYQAFFFILQTQPQYLGRLFKKLREKSMPEQDSKRVELLMMGVFGFAQKRREEYYLLKLISRAIKEELDACDTVQDYLRGNFFWSKLLAGYMRSPRDRKYLRDLLAPVVKEDILENDGLDLESDPMQIYRSAINNEELRTGQRSRRRADIPREEAIRDPETRETFIRHLQDLRDIADHFFLCLEETMHKMPYGIRFIAQQTFDLLCVKFPQEPQQHLITIVGHWLWKSYLQPALIQPDTWGVVDRGLSPMQKRNLGEVAKVVGQVAAGRLFGGENVYLQPINPYISDSLVRIDEIWTKCKSNHFQRCSAWLTITVIDVRDAEAQFDIDEYNDLYARTKPTLYMKLADIFAIHNLVSQDVAAVCPGQDDMLREVIQELGSAKNNENDMLHVSSAEITLVLNPKFHDVEGKLEAFSAFASATNGYSDPDAAVKSLFMETKRCVLYIIRVQTGTSLLDIMVRPITAEDEDRWSQLVHDEFLEVRKNPRRRSNPYTDSSSLLDITALSYTELKRIVLENILTLERAGRISRANHYQDLLNAIAIDIRTKHRRRVQRSREMDNVRVTLSALQEKASWLDSQLKSYNDYIEQAMVTLQQKSKGKKRFLLPFTKQYNHERELARSGRVPRFGSFKYSARNLAEKGVLVSWRGYSERQWDKINITISSDEVGVFYIEGSVGSLMVPGAAASVPLDDLLQAQFNNCQFMNLFGVEGVEASVKGKSDGPLRLNVNLLVHLLMRKFYRDE